MRFDYSLTFMTTKCEMTFSSNKINKVWSKSVYEGYTEHLRPFILFANIQF